MVRKTFAKYLTNKGYPCETHNIELHRKSESDYCLTAETKLGIIRSIYNIIEIGQHIKNGGDISIVEDKNGLLNIELVDNE